jgi:hypothetical protein
VLALVCSFVLLFLCSFSSSFSSLFSKFNMKGATGVAGAEWDLLEVREGLEKVSKKTNK